MKMELPHGKSNRIRRIEIRAEAIIKGAHWALEPDSTDINHGEEAEIGAAKVLANEWINNPPPVSPAGVGRKGIK